MVFPINPLSANTQRIKANSVPSSTTSYLNHCCPAGSPQSCRDCDLVNKWAMQGVGSIPCTSISFLSLFQTQSALHGENLGSDVSSTPELTKTQRLNLIPVSQGLCCRFLSQVKRSTCNTVESLPPGKYHFPLCSSRAGRVGVVWATIPITGVAGWMFSFMLCKVVFFGKKKTTQTSFRNHLRHEM